MAGGMRFAVLILLILVAEVLLRVYHQHTLRRSLPVELRAETRALTWEGIRDRYRIVCLGDSITFGDGLSATQAYPAVLTDLIGRSHPDPSAVVINSGLCGDTSVQGVARLERDVLWYRPHVVILAFGLNDGNLGFWPLDPLREREALGDGSLLGALEPWLNRSHLWRTLRSRAGRLARSLGWPGQAPPIAVDATPEPRVSRRGFRIALSRLIAALRRTGAAVIVLTPTPVMESPGLGVTALERQHQLAVYEDYGQIIGDIAAETATYLLDVRAVFGKHSVSEVTLLLAPDGVHLTAAGQRFLAESIHQALENGGFLVGGGPHRGLRGQYRAE
jgi:lysophospholipase L1-like esterase